MEERGTPENQREGAASPAGEETRPAQPNALLFLDLMSHNLINVHQSLYGHLSLLLEKTTLDERQTRYVKSCLRQNARGLALITSVRAFALSRQICAKSIVPMDLAQLLAAAVAEVRELFAERELAIEYVPPAEPCAVLGTPLLETVLANVLENAVRHTAADRRAWLRLTVAAGGDHWEVRVEDDGPGVPDAVKEKIFACLAPDGNGRGFGLAVTKEIVERVGGSIRVEDRLVDGRPRGSVFVIILKKGRPVPDAMV